MKNYIFKDKNGKSYKRIDKRQACKAYINYKPVFLCSCNLRPFAPFHFEVDINRKRDAEFLTDETSAKNRFRELVNSFEFYNCTNTETGLYTSFYVAIE